jgi:hypothetical protein
MKSAVDPAVVVKHLRAHPRRRLQFVNVKVKYIYKENTSVAFSTLLKSSVPALLEIILTRRKAMLHCVNVAL